MTKTSVLSKRKRLDELLGLLKSKESWISKDLSDELGVSQRTLMRDLNDLIESGVPIESDRGRGGGIRVNRYYGLGRVDFNYQEIIDLILALSTIEKMKSPLFLQDIKSIKNKIVRAFPESQRSMVNGIRKRIYIGDEASGNILKTYEAPTSNKMREVHRAFFERKKLEIKYTNEKGITRKRIIEPEYLLLNWPAWYVLGWDDYREDVRIFRIDRFKSIKLINEEFKLRKKAKYLEFLDEFFTTI